MPPGFGAGNAQLGLALGASIARHLGHGDPDPGHLARVLATVRNPGRLSVHEGTKGGSVIVDSAINGEGLRVALAYARARFGGEPDRIVTQLPAGKDLAGFGALLAPMRERVVFAMPAASHLPMPPPPAWAGRQATEPELPELLGDGHVLAVGTALFTGAVLGVLGVDTGRLIG
jgi:dihydrofolate synthase/folylpolyglutamate synthase